MREILFDEDDDDLINESLFERYDQMFTQYNNFGALSMNIRKKEKNWKKNSKKNSKIKKKIKINLDLKKK